MTEEQRVWTAAELVNKKHIKNLQFQVFWLQFACLFLVIWAVISTLAIKDRINGVEEVADWNVSKVNEYYQKADESIRMEIREIKSDILLRDLDDLDRAWLERVMESDPSLKKYLLEMGAHYTLSEARHRFGRMGE